MSWFEMGGLGVAMLSNRSGHCVGCAPPSAESLPYRSGIDPSQAAPFRDGLCFVVERQFMVFAAVIILFDSCRPSHIARLVMTVVVRVAIKAMRRTRTWSHITQKRGEGLPPLVGHADPSPTVLGKVVDVRVVTTALGVFPSQMLGCSVHAVSRGPANLAEASTTVAATTQEIASLDIDVVSALASTAPSCSSPETVRHALLKGGEPSEYLTGNVKSRSWHDDAVSIHQRNGTMGVSIVMV